MDDDHIKTEAENLIKMYIEAGKPRPSSHAGFCVDCRESTSSCTTMWPKDSMITWRCQECEDEKKSRELMRLALYNPVSMFRWIILGLNKESSKNK